MLVIRNEALLDLLRPSCQRLPNGLYPAATGPEDSFDNTVASGFNRQAVIAIQPEPALSWLAKGDIKILVTP